MEGESGEFSRVPDEGGGAERIADTIGSGFAVLDNGWILTVDDRGQDHGALLLFEGDGSPAETLVDRVGLGAPTFSRALGDADDLLYEDLSGDRPTRCTAHA